MSDENDWRHPTPKELDEILRATQGIVKVVMKETSGPSQAVVACAFAISAIVETQGFSHKKTEAYAKIIELLEDQQTRALNATE